MADGETIENILFKPSYKVGHIMGVIPDRTALDTGESIKTLSAKLEQKSVPSEIASYMVSLAGGAL